VTSTLDSIQQLKDEMIQKNKQLIDEMKQKNAKIKEMEVKCNMLEEELQKLQSGDW